MIEYLEHHIVDHCNLKCAGCSHFSPIADEWFEDIEDFKRDFTQLASITNVNTIRLMGGEPLLHPDVCEFLKVARSIFPTSEIQLVSNGILIPKLKDKLLPVCNENRIKVCVSNYHLNFNLREVLSGFNLIRIDEKSNLYNISFNLHEQLNPIDAFNHCDLHIHHWYYFQYGKFYPCCICANVKYFNKQFNLQLDENEEFNSISIYNHTEKEIKDFLNQPIPLCKYCNTYKRPHTYSSFHISNKDINEWICQ